MAATSAILRHRRDTAANWTSGNPVLEDGQTGFETDTKKSKLGNGVTAWNSLGYTVSTATPVFTHVFHGPSVVSWSWDNMPVAATFLFGSHRHVTRLDLTSSLQARLCVNVQSPAGATSSKLIAKYRTAFSTDVTLYSDLGTSEISCVIDAANTVVTSSWVNLATSAKADVFVCVVGSGGDGSTDPQFGTIEVQLR